MKLRSGTSNEAETEKEFTQSRISAQTIYHMLDCTTLRAQQTSCGIISTPVCRFLLLIEANNSIYEVVLGAHSLHLEIVC